VRCGDRHAEAGAPNDGAPAEGPTRLRDARPYPDRMRRPSTRKTRKGKKIMQKLILSMALCIGLACQATAQLRPPERAQIRNLREGIVPAGSIDTTEIADDAVTPAKMGDGDYGAFTVSSGTAALDSDAGGTVAAAVASAAETKVVCESRVITFTNLTLTATDGTDEGESQKIFDFPDGALNVQLAVMNAQVVSSSGATGAVLYVACGTAAAGDDSDLTSTEADLIPKTTLDPSSSPTNAFDAILAASAIFDGTSAAKDMYFNLAIGDDAMDADVTNTVTGSVTVYYLPPVDNQ